MDTEIRRPRGTAEGTDRIDRRVSTPASTYRLQLHKGFGFAEATALLPYLSSLGISTVYLSPVLRARPGSMHGYDVVDPTRLNPELGTSRQWSGLLRDCNARGMTLLLDIVPNHMAASPDNPWWRDVLENGRLSPYAHFFDIDWNAGGMLNGRVLLPVLTKPVSDVLAEGRVRVAAYVEGLCLDYNGLKLPLDIASYALVLRRAAWLANDREVGRVLLTLAKVVVEAAAQDSAAGEYETRQRIRLDVTAGLQAEASRTGSPNTLFERTFGPAAMRSLLSRQHYMLEYWKTARAHLNYRRFFDINDLIGIRVEDKDVFEDTHRLLRALAHDPAICGFRVDHIDGLREPLEYLRRLECLRTGPDPGTPPYVVVEKILTGDEHLPVDWPVEGTTGYEFLSAVNGLFVDPRGLKRLERDCRALVGRLPPRPAVTYRCKRLVLNELFKADLRRIGARMLDAAAIVICQQPALPHVTAALREVTARLPVYRTYARCGAPLSALDKERIGLALGDGKVTQSEATAHELVRKVLTLDVPDEARKVARSTLLSWQQLTGASMAKGFEDTTLYRDPVLISLNDVGGPPGRAAVSPDRFHVFNSKRLETWPDTLNCTSTHDTKRGEDARDRINVLSEIPGRWSEVARLAVERLPATTGVDIEPAMLLFLLQAVLGAWPVAGPSDTRFRERFRQYVAKAAREAKLHSNWTEPDERYEAALVHTVESLLSQPDFRALFDGLQRIVAFHGAINSLAQAVLKITSPGVPDFYQGTELWDLSLVDPDNRRPVDYQRRTHLLDEIACRAERDRAGFVREMLENWPDERVKMFVLWSALQVRRAHEDVFRRGSYVPLPASGRTRNHVFAFMRRGADSAAVVIVPRLSVSLCGEMQLPLGEEAWGRDVVRLPVCGLPEFEDVFTGRRFGRDRRELRLSDALADFPLCFMKPAR